MEHNSNYYKRERYYRHIHNLGLDDDWRAYRPRQKQDDRRERIKRRRDLELSRHTPYIFGRNHW